MMRGRPTMIRNLRPGIPVRIFAYVHGYTEHWIASDTTDFIRLVGRTHGLGEIRVGERVSLYGHRSYRRESFFVEEVENGDA